MNAEDIEDVLSNVREEQWCLFQPSTGRIEAVHPPTREQAEESVRAKIRSGDDRIAVPVEQAPMLASAWSQGYLAAQNRSRYA